MVEIINESKFANKISEGVVVVDFFATWCGPCKMLSPIIDSLAEEMKDSVKFIKVDADESVNILQEYGVAGLPTIAIFKEGQKQDMIVGFSPKEILAEKIENCLNK
ncbi:thioredoxin [Romboutsia sp. 1001216sp1]|uniref:thioredoxin n=1 Tax=unclassified Romboutsia TaxID=2626894 RepID=UPI00189C9566|nr:MULTISPECIES: thioredoxin [unclassified Romboutsia]MDB8789313.1 thioredoxin [Romboutsia sp. 1001216sp1]MDB8802111.1 thioredoxin [Romboutsia sp. 1001216sp1]MDB8813508.1 thioredoxin [Romboutsia sp. 1001216sp1]